MTGQKNMNTFSQEQIEAAAFRRLLKHFQTHTDVQNIDLMILADFCRNCLSNWYKTAAEEAGAGMSKEEARAYVYGMPYEDWKAKFQTEATAEQLEAMKARKSG